MADLLIQTGKEARPLHVEVQVNKDNEWVRCWSYELR
jgi:hypothetical protein